MKIIGTDLKKILDLESALSAEIESHKKLCNDRINNLKKKISDIDVTLQIELNKFQIETETQFNNEISELSIKLDSDLNIEIERIKNKYNQIEEQLVNETVSRIVNDA